jgi:mannose-6-phosphate isomerase-like protein (cupin superfamily)
VAATEKVLENQATGERIVFQRTTADTGGEALEYDLFFRPQGFLVREHLHPEQSERHEVVAGKLGLHLGGEERVLEPGDAVVVPAATPHRLFPVGDEQVHALFELRPALRTEELLETFVRLAKRGKVDAQGNPRPLELALLARKFEPEGYATRPPLAVQHVLLAPLAWVARLLGRSLD